jgi:hypothetical protein
VDQGLSKHTPDLEKLKVLARRLKKADDVIRLFPPDMGWKQRRDELTALRNRIWECIHLAEREAVK